jgi:hypothetical protein
MWTVIAYENGDSKRVAKARDNLSYETASKLEARFSKSYLLVHIFQQV